VERLLERCTNSLGAHNELAPLDQAVVHHTVEQMAVFLTTSPSSSSGSCRPTWARRC
jgi:hypothetical protein